MRELKMEQNLKPKNYLTIDSVSTSCKISCYIQPKSSKCAIVGIHDDKLKIALTAPPVDGQANAMLIKFLANFFKKPKRDVTIISGESSRNKIVLIQNINHDDLIKIDVNLS